MASTKTWFITGSSSGLGRLLCERALASGDRVAATLREPAALAELQRAYGERLWTAKLDVTDGIAIRDVMDRAFRELGRIDVVVSNAGFGLFGAAEEVSDAQIRTLLETNLVGSIAVVRAALPHLRAQGGGRVLQVSSEGGQIAYPNFSIYHASKWGIEGFIEAVALETAPFGISFTIVEPGPTATNFRAGIVSAQAMPIYGDTPSGAIRRNIESGAFVLKGDAQKCVAAMYDVASQVPAPRRLALGSDAYEHIHAALTSRLAELEAQRQVAYSADR